jgi:hypothetical protein
MCREAAAKDVHLARQIWGMEMPSKFATSILFATLVMPVVMPHGASAAKLPPLAAMKLGENQTTYIFDPSKVTAVAPTYSVTVTLKPVRANSEVTRGQLTPHVWGIAEIPLAINDTPENFLKELQLDSKFITLHSLSGALHLRASSIKYIIEPPLQTDRERGAKALVYLRSAVVDWSGVPRPWLVTETPDQVKALADEKRAQEDGE